MADHNVPSSLRRPTGTSPISIHSLHLLDGVSGSLPAPFDSILWCVDCWCSSTHVHVLYAGFADDLIAAGCATPEMVAPYRSGQRLIDADGDHVRREFRKGWLRLARNSSVERALQLPGITIEAMRAAKAKFDRRMPHCSCYSLDLSAYDRPRPHLRLIIDNTGERTSNS